MSRINFVGLHQQIDRIVEVNGFRGFLDLNQDGFYVDYLKAKSNKSRAGYNIEDGDRIKIFKSVVDMSPRTFVVCLEEK